MSRRTDFFEKKRSKRANRKSEYKTANSESYLIVSEGEKTEPNYFNGLKKLVLDSVGGQIDIKIAGQGMHTVSLVDQASLLNRNAGIIYNNVWIVLDKDDFSDFDEAISKAESMGFNVAWSNQSFEYWLYLHFAYSDAALHRKEWCKKLEEIFGKEKINSGKYDKNIKSLFDEVTSKGSIDQAIRNSKRRMADYKNGKDIPSKFDPGNTVYCLAEELLDYTKMK